MDTDSFNAFAQNELQLLNAGGQRSHGLTLSNSHSASSRAQQPLPLVLPQLHHLPLSTPVGASVTTQTLPGVAGQQQQQIQIPAANGSQPPDAIDSGSNNPSSSQQAQNQIQAQMEAGVLPTAEDKARYEAARKELIQALQKKRAVDRALAQLEVQIYNFEGSYLTETTAHSGGNIIQGFDSYMKTQNTGRRRHEITDADRVFSNSSLTYQKSLELIGDGDDQQTNGAFGIPGGADDSSLSLSAHILSAASSTGGRGMTPGLTTVVLPPPQTRGPGENAPMTAAQQKKARDKEYQRRKRANAAQIRSQQAAAAQAVQAQKEALGRETSTDGGGDDSANGNVSTGARGSSRRPNKRPRPVDDD